MSTAVPILGHPDNRSRHKNARPNRIEIVGETAIIYLMRRNREVLECLIDVADLPIVLSHRRCWCAWCPDKSARKPVLYARSKKVYLHRLILNAPDGANVDHKNGNGLDNRRENLRIVSQSLNCRNRHVPTKSKSGLRGVRWEKRTNKWVGRITLNYKQVHLGSFETKEEAAAAVQEKIRSLFQEASHA